MDDVDNIERYHELSKELKETSASSGNFARKVIVTASAPLDKNQTIKDDGGLYAKLLNTKDQISHFGKALNESGHAPMFKDSQKELPLALFVPVDSAMNNAFDEFKLKDIQTTLSESFINHHVVPFEISEETFEGGLQTSFTTAAGTQLLITPSRSQGLLSKTGVKLDPHIVQVIQDGKVVASANIINTERSQKDDDDEEEAGNLLLYIDNPLTPV